MLREERGGGVKGAAPESDSVCLCPSGVYEAHSPGM